MIHQAGPFVGGRQLCVRCGFVLVEPNEPAAWDEGARVEQQQETSRETEEEPDCPFTKDAWKQQRRHVALLVSPQYLIDFLKRREPQPGRMERVGDHALPPDATFVRAGYDQDGQLRLIVTSKEFAPVELGARVPNWPSPTIQVAFVEWPVAKVVWGCCECDWYSDCEAASELAISHCNLTGHHTWHLDDMRKMRTALSLRQQRLEALPRPYAHGRSR